MNELKKQLHSCRETIIQRDATINENKNNHALAMQNLQHENGLLKQENENYERERIKIMKGKGLVDEENQSIKHKLQVLQREVDQLTIQRAKHLDIISIVVVKIIFIVISVTIFPIQFLQYVCCHYSSCTALYIFPRISKN